MAICIGGSKLPVHQCNAHIHSAFMFFKHFFYIKFKSVNLCAFPQAHTGVFVPWSIEYPHQYIDDTCPCPNFNTEKFAIHV